MLRHGLSLLFFFISTRLVLGTSASSPTVVHLDQGTFVGNSTGNVTKFLGIPFAQPPVGNLRFRLPVPNSPFSGTHNATEFGPACIQQTGPPFNITLLNPVAQQLLGGPRTVFNDSEDCLTINVIKPANVSATAKLPVLVWIYGGGFENGATSDSTFNGEGVVERSLELGEPVLFASMNYRLSALGFPGGKEVKEAGVGNLGLQDQREALRWIQKYIHAFGGDPDKVTIWGESAGAISVALQMLTNGGNTEGLFRAGFMQSGSPPPIGDITDGQPFYDALVEATGCAGSHDTLECLRTVPISTLRAAIDASPFFEGFMSLNLAWGPRADGVFLRDDPQRLVLEGSVAKIPFITGDCDDEGTLFSISTLNLTTDAEVFDFVKENYLPDASDAQVTQLLTLYPNDTTQGSPFDTGTANAVTPEFKRLASLQGDLVFQAPRRFFLQQRSAKQTTYAFLSKRDKALPDLGAFHSSDLSNVFGPGDLTDYLIRFGATLNPNGNTNIQWPVYTTESPQLLTFLDGAVPQNITLDDFRIPQMQFLTNLSVEFPS